MDGSELTIHWHGVHQRGTQISDGVPFVTQCPISEGNTFRYQWVAGNAGTHFWHAHSGWFYVCFIYIINSIFKNYDYLFSDGWNKTYFNSIVIHGHILKLVIPIPIAWCPCLTMYTRLANFKENTKNCLIKK